eukprot:GGOE01014009.1.p1 GENE.GGOE01014009.1~~GGOE01014009.1.p1  ORF type:complete len:206 (-),score=78.21 GGOE01014009.1:223-840(-)
MSKKKGLSMDEKYEKAKEFLLQRKEPFTLKELEKLLPKAKGIVWQSVKQIVDTLVADGVVQSDKIGSNVFFWCFPSAQGRSLQAKVDQLQRRTEDLKRKRADLDKAVQVAKKGKVDTPERQATLSQWEEVTSRHKELTLEIQKYAENDPEFLAKVEEYAQLAKDAANRWTDAVFMVKGYVKNKFNVEEERLNKEFGISADFDYVD